MQKKANALKNTANVTPMGLSEMNRVTSVTGKTVEARRWYIFEWSKKEKT
jgi:hypothetical protein